MHTSPRLCLSRPRCSCTQLTFVASIYHAMAVLRGVLLIALQQDFWQGRDFVVRIAFPPPPGLVLLVKVVQVAQVAVMLSLCELILRGQGCSAHRQAGRERWEGWAASARSLQKSACLCTACMVMHSVSVGWGPNAVHPAVDAAYCHLSSPAIPCLQSQLTSLLVLVLRPPSSSWALVKTFTADALIRDRSERGTYRRGVINNGADVAGHEGARGNAARAAHAPAAGDACVKDLQGQLDARGDHPVPLAGL